LIADTGMLLARRFHWTAGPVAFDRFRLSDTVKGLGNGRIPYEHFRMQNRFPLLLKML
jgi:hypothetical protein